MNFVKLIYNGQHYSYDSGSDLGMDILGCFLSCDIECRISAFREWALNDREATAGGDITLLDKENGIIVLTDMYSEEDEPTELKMSTQQFVQLLDDWEQKVCKVMPAEVVVKHDGDKFVIETTFSNQK